ncbi:baseplate J/gp47 family protein [Azonexus sp.]|uniref:baseplate J/gp47 family protein n=1 Tax=Azonexus sp. TaxID=1872668 RepID=UPI0035B1F994
MPFERPDLPTLIERATADIESRLPGADARVRRSNLGVLARVHSGAVHGLYGFLEWIAQQILPDTAEAEILERHANIWLPNGRLSASYASGSVSVPATAGTVFPVGTVFTRADGARYSSAAEAIAAGGAALVTVTAEEPGQAGNCAAGVALLLDSPIAGANASGTVAFGGISGGADIESDSALRTRLLARIKQPPHGGAAHDYVAWALEVPGVTRAWVYPEEQGPGTVTVRFVRDLDADMIPSADEVAAVQAYIDALRPVTARPLVVAPIATPLDFEIQGIVPATAAVRAAVEAELRDLLSREAVPGGTILLSHIRAAISAAAGETDYVLVAPAANVTHVTGEMAVMGTVTWL